MQTFISSIPSRLRDPELRPLLVVAGAVTAAAGAYYLYYRFSDRQRRPPPVETTIRHTPEDLVQSLCVLELSVSNADYGQDVQLHDGAQAEEITEENRELIRSPPLRTEPTSPHHHLSSPPGSLPTSVPKAEPTSPPWTEPTYPRSQPASPPASPSASPPTSLSSSPPSTSSFPPSSPSGAQTSSPGQILLFSPSGAQTASPGEIPPFSPSGAQTSSPGQILLFSPSGAQTSSPAHPQASSPTEPQEAVSAQLSPTPAEQSAPQTAGVVPEAWQVPALYSYLLNKRVPNIPLRLTALRQAFSTILSDLHCCYHVSLAGNQILCRLATLNSRNLADFHKAYERLLLVAQNPSYAEGIEMELVQIGIQQFNFIDIVYELVMFGVLAGTRHQIRLRTGGFLHHLMFMLNSFTSTTIQRRPRAEEYLLLAQKEMLFFLDEIFSLEESAYADPKYLATSVWEILQFCFQQLLKIPEYI